MVLKKQFIQMKTIYYISLVLCTLTLCVFIFSPFGGPFGILDIIKRGYYDEEYINLSFGSSLADLILSLNKAIALLFFSAILFCLSLPFLPKMSTPLKHKLALICLIIAMLIVMFPKITSLFLIAR